MVPHNISIMAAVLGMVVLTILAASMVSAYQRHLAIKRQRIQRLLHGAQRGERLLTQLAGVSLPRDIRLMLRNDVLDRYRAVSMLHKSYPGIEQMIQQAQQRINAEGIDAGQVLPVPANEEVFEQWQVCIAELFELLKGKGLLRPQAPDVCQTYREQLLERQAECLFGHFMNMADQLKQSGREMVARNRIQQLSELLRALGLHTKRVNALIEQAEEAYQYLLNSQVTAAGQGAAKA